MIETIATPLTVLLIPLAIFYSVYKFIERKTRNVYGDYSKRLHYEGMSYSDLQKMFLNILHEKKASKNFRGINGFTRKEVDEVNKLIDMSIENGRIYKIDFYEDKTYHVKYYTFDNPVIKMRKHIINSSLFMIMLNRIKLESFRIWDVKIRRELNANM